LAQKINKKKLVKKRKIEPKNLLLFTILSAFILKILYKKEKRNLEIKT